MTTIARFSLWAAALLLIVSVASAQDPKRESVKVDGPVKTYVKGDRSAARKARMEKFAEKNPEIAVKLREFQGLTREEKKARIDGFKSLTPAERKARADQFLDQNPEVKAQRDKFLANHPKAAERIEKLRALSPDERKAKMQGLRETHPRAARKLGPNDETSWRPECGSTWR